jgi:beta-phosphoglucomutase-like phosphatase (HAD superfamily)
VTVARPRRRASRAEEAPGRRVVLPLPRRTVQAAPTTTPLAPSDTSHGLDLLAMQWWAALDSAQSALQAAGRDLGPQELQERGRSLVRERGEVVELLRTLSADLHSDPRLLSWLVAPGAKQRTLGLPAPVAGCVFDLDGVLTTSAMLHAAAWTETFDALLLERADRSRRELIPFDPRHDYHDHVAGRPRLNGVRSFLVSRGISLPEGSADDLPGVSTVHGLANLKNRALQDRLTKRGVEAFEAARWFLEAARVIGVRRSVVSASANTGAILDRAGLAGLIERRVDGNTIEARQLRPKPAPDTILAACEELHLEPGQVAAFETTLAGVAAARAAGVKLVVGVNRSGDAEALRASDADLVVGDLGELIDRSLAA